jgi:hypothetical protein
MIVRDLFNLALALVTNIDYMTDSYDEYDSTLDDIPDKTLDDIMDEINRENTNDEETPTNDDTPTDSDEEPTDDDSETTDTDPEPEEESKMDKYIDRANITISTLNTIMHNAEIGNVMDCDVLDQRETVVYTCYRVTLIISILYDITRDVSALFNSDKNINKRSKFIIDSYNALVKFTKLVNDIYNALDAKAYLTQVNGPITSDIEHWNTEEVQNHLVTLEAWISTDDDKKLSLIDEAIQFDLKYAALLKKLVISEFKGFDEYYNGLIEFLCTIHKAVNNYEPEGAFVSLEDSSAFYDPSILAKISAITMVTEGYIPFEPEPESDPGE